MGTPFDDPIVPVYQAKYRRIFREGLLWGSISAILSARSMAWCLHLFDGQQTAPGLFSSDMV
jgi:hypothetical protein